MARGLKPIVVVNKLDRPNARPDWVVDQTFDLFDRLGASDEQMDFPVVFTSATEGWASLNSTERGADMTPLFQTIVDRVPPPDVDLKGPFQLQVSALEYSSYVGVIGIGRIKRGRIERNSEVVVIGADGATRTGRVLQILGFHGLERIERPQAAAGDIIAFTGLDEIHISDTLCHPDAVEPLPAQPDLAPYVGKYLRPIVGDKTPAEVTDADVERIHGKMARTKGLKGNKTIAPATQKMILALLVRIAAFGVEEKRCPGLVAKVELPAVDNVVTEFLTKDETARLLAILQAGTFVDKKGVKHEISRDAIDIIYFLLTTGMRRGEVLGIEWKNVGPEFITVPHPKERKSKTIRINPIIADILESRKDNGSAFVFPARTWEEKDAHIVDPKRSLNLVKRLAKLPTDFRCAHGFRHNWGYWAVMPVEEGGAGADVVTVGATMGHASIKTTERYIKAADAAKKRLAGRMATIFAPKELPANVVSIK